MNRPPVLLDAGLLSTFAAAEALDVLESRVQSSSHPLWTYEVRSELLRGATWSTHCVAVLQASWLGEPHEAQSDDLKHILRYRTALGGDHPSNLGEASSVYWAEQLNGRFATDDNAAYDWAKRKLGVGRVIDTVDILREAVAMDEISAERASIICQLAFDQDRSLRRIHPAHPAKAHFA
jgi:hypothetical protein